MKFLKKHNGDMTLQEKIDYLFQDKEGKPLFGERKLVIRQNALIKDINNPYDTETVYQVILSCPTIGNNGCNYFDEAWGMTFDDALDTLVNDKENGLELPIQKEVTENDRKLNAIREYIQVVKINSDKYVDIHISDDNAKVLVNWVEWDIDDFYKRYINLEDK